MSTLKSKSVYCHQKYHHKTITSLLISFGIWKKKYIPCRFTKKKIISKSYMRFYLPSLWHFESMGPLLWITVPTIKNNGFPFLLLVNACIELYLLICVFFFFYTSHALINNCKLVKMIYLVRAYRWYYRDVSFLNNFDYFPQCMVYGRLK